MAVMFGIAGHMGVHHNRECGSFHMRDPWSIMDMAYMMRPWTIKMRSLEVMPRTLAYDLMLAAEEGGITVKLGRPANETHRMIEDMEARVITGKTIF